MHRAFWYLWLAEVRRSRLLRAGIAVMLAVALPAHAAGGAAENSAPQFAPPGDWVKPHFYDQQSPASLPDPGENQHWLLQERQINAAQNETFVHAVRQVLTMDGVQNGSTLSFDFNPGYQSLTLHWARIWRGAEHLERLDPGSVKIVQPERDLDEYALNGQKSAVLVLDDVRVGDILDYAYTIKGANPVLGGRFSAVVPVQLAQPAERLLTRVLWPAGRRLYAKPHGCAVQPAVIAGKGALEYVWDFQPAPGAVAEDFLPRWYDPEPWVQLSECKTWAEVNQWAAALFRVTAPCAPELAAKIAAWRQLDSQEAQVLAVLRFVQEDVRYFGIEIGDSTEKPAEPSTVFTRRFGDCKDKSLLFVTILRSLGMEAFPVLVNTVYGRAIEDWQPTASAFDHCIAAVVCDGQTYWLDPTMNYQRGPLASHYLPAYERGLVISPRTTGLTVIPTTTSQPQTTITEYFLLRGKTGPAELKVVTLAADRDADTLRELFATTKRSDLEKHYTHFYADLYPGIRMSSPIDLEDDEAQDRFQTTEYYALDPGWLKPDQDRRYRCTFYPAAMAAALGKPVDTDRRQPLAIRYPEHLILHTEATLPEDLPAEAGKNTVDDAAFTFRKGYQSAGNKLIMGYEYQALSDVVYPDQAGEYLQHLDQCSQALGYTLTWPGTGKMAGSN